MDPTDEEVLRALSDYISKRTDQARQNLISILSQYVSTAYFLGGEVAAKEIGSRTGPLGIQGLQSVIGKLGPHLDNTFGALGSELTDTINAGLRSGWSFDHVKKALAEQINGGWGKTISFDNVGQVRKIVNVSPNGSLTWVKREISQKVTLPSDVYAETLARTTMKQAYSEGHFARYEGAGCPGWVYISVADERTRPKHLALHGRVFLFGTDEEAMAREVMAEYNCRCRPKAYFDDPKLDTPAEEYHQERAAWAKQALDEIPTGATDQISFLKGILRASPLAAA